VIAQDVRQSLLQIARAAVVSHVMRCPQPIPDTSGDLGRPAGVFVTIHVHDCLRGCIGQLEPEEPIAVVVARSAVAACSADPRFAPVEAHELPDLALEISVLGGAEPVNALEDTVIGRDGLIVEQGSQRGLLLPQVAVEWGWDRETFVAQTCRKAGLHADAWKNGASIWRFEAEVFKEGRQGG
jgi:AmmeMemoRadiSam system protein A